jgi:hypothetical protein
LALNPSDNSFDQNDLLFSAPGTNIIDTFLFSTTTTNDTAYFWFTVDAQQNAVYQYKPSDPIPDTTLLSITNATTTPIEGPPGRPITWYSFAATITKFGPAIPVKYFFSVEGTNITSMYNYANDQVNVLNQVSPIYQADNLFFPSVLKFSINGTTITDEYLYNLLLPLDPNMVNRFGMYFNGSANEFYSPVVIQFTDEGGVVENITGPPCFKEGAKILTDKGYVLVQSLRKGHMVQTLRHGFLPVHAVGKRVMFHPADPERLKDQLYSCAYPGYEEVFEELVLTGCHSLLVDAFGSDAQREKVREVNGDLYVTDQKYRLPVCADPRATVYGRKGAYTVYHFALENDNYYSNYGVYANGLLVETCSKRYLKELSNMVMVE